MISDKELRARYAATLQNPPEDDAAYNSVICPYCGGTHPVDEMCPDEPDDEQDNPGEEPEICPRCQCDDQECKICEQCGGCDCCCECED